MAAFPAMQNERVFKAISGDKTLDKTPVWIMRQAGRYLPEFQEVRKQHSFFDVCKTPELACEVTLQPIRRFEPLFDASIIFSDILVVPQALGMHVEMKPGVGPWFENPLKQPADIDAQLVNLDQFLTSGDAFPYQLVNEQLSYVMAAITLTRQKLEGRVPLYGFCGAPWTLMAYMVEGSGSKTFSKCKRWLWSYPEASHKLLTMVTQVSIAYLVRQIEAGAQLVQVFDSWAGELSPVAFTEFSLPYLRMIASGVKSECKKRGVKPVPMVVFAKGAHYAIEQLVETEFDVFGLDWTLDVQQVKQRIRQHFIAKPELKRRIALQGNMDPTYLFSASTESLAREAERVIRTFLLETDGSLTKDIGYICNLGHGIQPETPIENVHTFLSTVDRVSRQILSQHQQ